MQKASKNNWLKKRPKSDKPKAKGKSSKNEKKLTTRSQLLEQQEEAAQRIHELTLATEDEERKMAEAEAKMAEAEIALKRAQKEKNSAKNRFFRNIQKLEKWTKKSNSIAEMLQKIESQIYLVAPGYKGALPDTGKLVTVVPFEGAYMEKGDELLNDPTAEDLIESGFELISEARDAYDFARLVTKYQFNEIKVEILIDDERIVHILQGQGLVV